VDRIVTERLGNRVLHAGNYPTVPGQRLAAGSGHPDISP
jgi:hypothetical protein